jgi:hypothetical protein
LPTPLTPPPSAPVLDLWKIDFEALRCRFKESKHKNMDLEVPKAALLTACRWWSSS